jgi:Terminase large subunit, T4likevirus-type, N-terminal
MTASALVLDFARALDPTLIARDVGLDQLDAWQAKLIDDPPKRLLCCCGRQVGKSTAAAVCALNSVIYQAPATVVMVSPSQRQSVELFRTFHAMYSRLPGRPAAQYETLQRLELENGSRVISLPGSERTVRGLASVDLIVIDEASRVDDELLAATRPMLAVSNGALFALTTPAGKRGWFYEQWLRGVGWQRISIKSTECPRISQEFLDQEREQLGPLIFAQEYLCEFHDEVGSAFLADLIAATLTDSFPPLFPPTHWAHSHGR